MLIYIQDLEQITVEKGITVKNTCPNMVAILPCFRLMFLQSTCLPPHEVQEKFTKEEREREHTYAVSSAITLLILEIHI